jgi:hypothetical protein
VVVDDDLPLESAVRGVQAGPCAWKASWEDWVGAGEELFQYDSLERYPQCTSMAREGQAMGEVTEKGTTSCKISELLSQRLQVDIHHHDQGC